MRTQDTLAMTLAGAAMVINSVASAQSITPVLNEQGEVYRSSTIACTKDGYLVNAENTYFIDSEYAGDEQPDIVLTIIRGVEPSLSRNFTGIAAESTKASLQGLSTISAFIGTPDAIDSIRYQTTMTFGAECRIG